MENSRQPRLLSKPSTILGRLLAISLVRYTELNKDSNNVCSTPGGRCTAGILRMQEAFTRLRFRVVVPVGSNQG
jgi:hypothetical protein